MAGLPFMALRFEDETFIRALPAFRQRGFSGIVKQALQETVVEWHRKFLPRHFTRRAYSLYSFSGGYRSQKRTGDPFVDTGTLRDRVTGPISTAAVSGTSKEARIELAMGRPPGQTEEDLKEQVFIEMRKRRISHSAAQRAVYSRARYSRGTREAFARDMPVVAGSESRHLSAFLRDRIVLGLNRRNG